MARYIPGSLIHICKRRHQFFLIFQNLCILSCFEHILRGADHIIIFQSTLTLFIQYHFYRVFGNRYILYNCFCRSGIISVWICDTSVCTVGISFGIGYSFILIYSWLFTICIRYQLRAIRKCYSSVWADHDSFRCNKISIFIFLSSLRVSIRYRSDSWYRRYCWIHWWWRIYRRWWIYRWWWIYGLYDCGIWYSTVLNFIIWCFCNVTPICIRSRFTVGSYFFTIYCCSFCRRRYSDRFSIRFTWLRIFVHKWISRTSLQICFCCFYISGALNCIATVITISSSCNSNQRSCSGNRSVVKNHRCTANWSSCYVSSAVCYKLAALANSKCSAADFQGRLSAVAFSCGRICSCGSFITFDIYFSFHLYISVCHNNRWCIVMCLCSIGKEISVGVDHGILYGRSIIQNQLSIDWSTCQEFSVIIIMVDRYCSTIFYFNLSIYGRISQIQCSAIFYFYLHTAENLHIDHCKITSIRNIKCLWDISTHHLLPRQIVSQIAICTALFWTEPGF